MQINCNYGELYGAFDGLNIYKQEKIDRRKMSKGITRAGKEAGSPYFRGVQQKRKKSRPFLHEKRQNRLKTQLLRMIRTHIEPKEAIFVFLRV